MHVCLGVHLYMQAQVPAEARALEAQAVVSCDVSTGNRTPP